MFIPHDAASPSSAFAFPTKTQNINSMVPFVVDAKGKTECLYSDVRAQQFQGQAFQAFSDVTLKAFYSSLNINLGRSITNSTVKLTTQLSVKELHYTDFKHNQHWASYRDTVSTQASAVSSELAVIVQDGPLFSQQLPSSEANCPIPPCLCLSTHK